MYKTKIIAPIGQSVDSSLRSKILMEIAKNKPVKVVLSYNKDFYNDDNDDKDEIYTASITLGEPKRIHVDHIYSNKLMTFTVYLGYVAEICSIHAPLNSLPVSVPISQKVLIRLHKLGLKTLHEVYSKTIRELYTFNGVGKKAVTQLEDFAETNGLEFGIDNKT